MGGRGGNVRRGDPAFPSLARTRFAGVLRLERGGGGASSGAAAPLSPKERAIGQLWGSGSIGQVWGSGRTPRMGGPALSPSFGGPGSRRFRAVGGASLSDSFGGPEGEHGFAPGPQTWGIEEGPLSDITGRPGS